MEKVVGIEVHVELKSNSKVFSYAENNYSLDPNTYVSVVDLGYPGVLPRLNKKVIDMALSAALAFNCKINKLMHFDRKNYFYPDLPKGYQITQQDTPIGYDGYIEIEVNGNKKKIGIERIHIEEDTCKSIHTEAGTLLNANRAGVPLIEIVSKPDLRSSEEAVAYLEKLREILLYLGISDVKIEEGSMRCDCNVSVHEEGTVFGTRTEIKNIGSISNVGLAINYEAKRQTELIKAGDKIRQETRRYDYKKNQTILMRVKETGNDYRYFPEPDIPYLVLTDEMIEEVTKTIPVSADVRRKKYQEAGINEININKLIANKDLSDYLEEFTNLNLKTASNLLLGDIQAYLNKVNKSILETKLTKDKMIKLVSYLDDGKISNKNFKDIVLDIMETDKEIDTILEEKGIQNVVDN